MRRRRWADRVATWGAGVVVATVAGMCGLHPVRSAVLGALGAVMMAAALTHGGRWARWYREHTAAAGLWTIAAVYVTGAAVCAWLRWGA